MVKWDIVTKPKNTGGLGLKQAHIKNKTCNTSLEWRTYNNTNTNWARVLVRKHYSGTANRGKANTRVWQYVQKGCKVCSKASRWVVHKGDMVNFLEDIWLPNMKPLKSILKGPWQQVDLNRKIDTLHCNGTWDLNSFSYITTIIQSTFIPLNARSNDKLVWNLTPTRLFSSMSVYFFITSNLTPILPGGPFWLDMETENPK